MTTLIAIDSSTSLTGVAIYHDACFFKNISLEGIKDRDDEDIKIEYMMKSILNILNLEKPEIIIIESPTSVKNNPQTQKNLSRIMGAVEAWCILNNCEFNYMFPSQWRKWCIKDTSISPPAKGLKRPELKKWAVMTCKKLYPNSTIKTDDDAECVLIGRAHIKWFENEFNVKIKEVCYE